MNEEKNRENFSNKIELPGLNVNARQPTTSPKGIIHSSWRDSFGLGLAKWPGIMVKFSGKLTQIGRIF